MIEIKGTWQMINPHVIGLFLNGGLIGSVEFLSSKGGNFVFDCCSFELGRGSHTHRPDMVSSQAWVEKEAGYILHQIDERLKLATEGFRQNCKIVPSNRDLKEII